MSSGLPLATLANDINARVAAGDRDMKRAEDHYLAAGLQLVEARKRCKEEKVTWALWVRGHLAFGLSRSYELLSIGDGKKTPSEVQSAASERMQKTRTNRAAENVRNVADAQPKASSAPDQLIRNTLREEWMKMFETLTNDQRETELNRMKETYRG